MSQRPATAIALAIGTITMSFASAALAESSRLSLIIAGEAYDGPPRFEVTFDGTPLGEGVVARAIDTATVGRFADAADRTPFIEHVVFEIPDYLFKNDAEVRVRLTNEAFGGPGSDRDRNLFLSTVSVNGGAVTVSGLVTATDQGFKPNQTVGEFLLLADGTEEGVAAAPRGGWPEPRPALVAAIDARLPETPPEGVRTLVMPATGVVPDEVPQVELASVQRSAEATTGDETGGVDSTGRCNLDQIYNVVGFNENSNELTPRLTERLDQILEDIGAAQCRVVVTGYSSNEGSYATNALFAVERAQNVLAYLKRQGLDYYRATAAGGGATEQFGPTPAANRRVVVTVLP